jgi:hypothetical protein
MRMSVALVVLAYASETTKSAGKNRLKLGHRHLVSMCVNIMPLTAPVAPKWPSCRKNSAFISPLDQKLIAYDSVFMVTGWPDK